MACVRAGAIGPFGSSNRKLSRQPHWLHHFMNHLMEWFWITDSAGTHPPESFVLSKNDKRAVNVMESEMQLVNGHLEMG